MKKKIPKNRKKCEHKFKAVFAGSIPICLECGIKVYLWGK